MRGGRRPVSSSAPTLFHGVWCHRYAFYSLLIVAVYIVGLPLTVFIILFRRRHKLFGDPADPFVATTRSTYGFLYEVSRKGAELNLADSAHPTASLHEGLLLDYNG